MKQTGEITEQTKKDGTKKLKSRFFSHAIAQWG